PRESACCRIFSAFTLLASSDIQPNPIRLIFKADFPNNLYSMTELKVAFSGGTIDGRASATAINYQPFSLPSRTHESDPEFLYYRPYLPRKIHAGGPTFANHPYHQRQ